MRQPTTSWQVNVTRLPHDRRIECSAAKLISSSAPCQRIRRAFGFGTILLTFDSPCSIALAASYHQPNSIVSLVRSECSTITTTILSDDLFPLSAKFLARLTKDPSHDKLSRPLFSLLTLSAMVCPIFIRQPQPAAHPSYQGCPKKAPQHIHLQTRRALSIGGTIMLEHTNGLAVADIIHWPRCLIDTPAYPRCGILQGLAKGLEVVKSRGGNVVERAEDRVCHGSGRAGKSCKLWRSSSAATWS